MSIRTGIDLTSVERVESTLERFGPRFHRKYFPEITDGDNSVPYLPPETYAGLWAAKEAAFKAIGLGCRWRGVRIQYERTGRPDLTVDYEKARMDRSPIPRGAEWDCSISHDAGMAVAVVVCHWTD